MFGSPETAFLLTTPAADDQVFAFKYQGAIGFSSWAFILLGSPLFLAYGLIAWVPWYFYLLVPLFFVGFVLVPGSLGALLCLVVVNTVPRRPRQLLLGAAFLALAGVLVWSYGTIRSNWRLALFRANMERLLEQSSVAQNPLLPSHWMACGLMAAARGQPGEAIFKLALVSANGLFLYLVTAWAAKRLYRRGYNRLASGSFLRRRYRTAWFDRAFHGATALFDPQMRVLLIKDFRSFRTDRVIDADYLDEKYPERRDVLRAKWRQSMVWGQPKEP